MEEEIKIEIKENKKKLKQSLINFNSQNNTKENKFFHDKFFQSSLQSIIGNYYQIENNFEICYCNEKMILQQVRKNDKNNGRYFYSCKLKKCQKFLWTRNLLSRSLFNYLIWKDFSQRNGWKFITKQKYLAGNFVNIFFFFFFKV